MKHFYILFLIIVSVFFVFFIGAYTYRRNTVIEGAKKPSIKKIAKSAGKGLKTFSKIISKTITKINNNLNPAKLLNRMKKRMKARKNRERNRRIKLHILKANSLLGAAKPGTDSFVSSKPMDYLQLELNDFYNFYIVNHTSVYKIWVNVKPQTRTYLKEKYKRFIEIKRKILDFLNAKVNTIPNDPKILTSSSQSFDLPKKTNTEGAPTTVSTTVSSSSSAKSSDYSKNIFEQVQPFIDLIHQTNSTPEAFTDFFGNSDNGQPKKNDKISIPYYVNIYDEYADSAYFKSYDKIEVLLKKYETYFDKNTDIIKYVVDGIKQAPTVENGKTIQKGQTLYYLNTKLEFFYKLINTIEQKTDYGKQLIS